MYLLGNLTGKLKEILHVFTICRPVMKYIKIWTIRKEFQFEVEKIICNAHYGVYLSVKYQLTISKKFKLRWALNAQN
jgi:hypothetical protein